MFDISSDAKLKALTPMFNVVVASPENGPALGPFLREACFADACVYRRPGPCAPPGDYTINGWLEANDS
jgi:hypothetical protein